MQKLKLINHFIDQNKIHANLEPNAKGTAFAPSNIALIKYWGKRDLELNLPNTKSLSISLSDKGATTEISVVSQTEDIVFLNDKEVDRSSDFYQRLVKFLDLFRFKQNYRYLVKTSINIPVAAGVASSACGFAALVLAIDKLFNWNLSKQDLSILARLGSGSASRSVFNGFVEWKQGVDNNLGLDSIAKPIDCSWNQLRVGLLLLSKSKKKISSRDAMLRSVNTSPYYFAWPEVVAKDLNLVKKALITKDFELLGQTAEQNAIAMHSLMQTSIPPVMYSTEDTIKKMHKIWYLRSSDKIPVYFTQDAGPNLKLLFLEDSESAIKESFPEISVIKPFKFCNMID